MGLILYFFKSNQDLFRSSSAPSIEFLIALSPPAIIPIITLLSTPNVGGHSDASTIPSLPGVPEPMWKIIYLRFSFSQKHYQ